MGNLFFTIKLPRSGGTTLCKKWQQHEYDVVSHRFMRVDIPPHLRTPRVVVSPDNFRLALGYRFHYAHEEAVWNSVHHSVKALLYDYDVMLDCTNTKKHSIYKVLNLQEDATYVYVDTPEHVCLERAVKTGQEDLLPVIRRMAINLGELKKEGLDKVVADLRTQVLSNNSRRAIANANSR